MKTQRFSSAKWLSWSCSQTLSLQYEASLVSLQHKTTQRECACAQAVVFVQSRVLSETIDKTAGVSEGRVAFTPTVTGVNGENEPVILFKEIWKIQKNSSLIPRLVKL